jgi:sensor histidine kinase YesM
MFEQYAMFLKKIRLPVLFSLLLSLLNILNTNTFNSNDTNLKILVLWAISFVYLLIIWFANQRLLNYNPSGKKSFARLKKVLAVTLLNGACIALMVFINFRVIRGLMFHEAEISGSWIFFIRIFLAPVIVVVIQLTLKSLSEKDTILLTNEQLKNENLQTKFELLKQQINPHFLFNALNTLRIMIRENDSHSEEFVLKLSGLYRELMSKKDASCIPLSEEITFFTNYLFLIRSRFQDMINVEMHIYPESMNLTIPTFSLQLLLENCIKHNIVSASKPLLIKVWQETTDELIIENNLQPKSMSEEKSGMGLKNLKTRYELLNVTNGLSIIQSPANFKVTLKLLSL